MFLPPLSMLWLADSLAPLSHSLPPWACLSTVSHLASFPFSHPRRTLQLLPRKSATATSSRCAVHPTSPRLIKAKVYNVPPSPSHLRAATRALIVAAATLAAIVKFAMPLFHFTAVWSTFPSFVSR